MNDLRVGVDLGGTKTEAVVVRVRGGRPEVLARRRVATERDRGYDHIVEATRALVVDVARDAGLGDLPPVGVGMPGSVTFRGADGARSDVPLVKNSNTTALNGRPFRADLARALGCAAASGDAGGRASAREGERDGARAIAFANDADCFALAEATWGAARDARVAFGVILGTGVGGGVVLRDRAGEGAPRAWDGAQGIAGEWGHVVLDPDRGPPCYCGRRGCVETYLSGPAIEAAYAARGAGGATLPLLEISRLAAAGDADASALLAERLDVLGRALATVIDVLDPDVVVLGGGVSNVEAFSAPAAAAAVARWVFNDELATRIVTNELGDSAGVLGAALLPG
jgi:predicted NBD/HSP70 family sugar kinase